MDERRDNMSDMTRAEAIEALSCESLQQWCRTRALIINNKELSLSDALTMGIRALRQIEEIDDIVHHCDNYEDVAYNVLYVVDSNQYK